jgi:hypothetical protein
MEYACRQPLPGALMQYACRRPSRELLKKPTNRDRNFRRKLGICRSFLKFLKIFGGETYKNLRNF